jgi:hypothetical protein
MTLICVYTLSTNIKTLYMHIQIWLYLNVNIHEIVHEVLRSCHAGSNVVLAKNLMFVFYREHFKAIKWL